MRSYVVIAAIAVACLFGCATFKNAMRTVDDIATDACMIFGTEHPAEFEHLVRAVEPAALASTDVTSLNVHDLCALKTVVQPFIDDQLKLQQSTAASLHMQMEQGARDAVPAK